MGSRQPSTVGRRGGWRGNLLIALTIGLALFLGPRVIDGWAGFEWTKYYAVHGIAGRRAMEQAERAGRAAARAVENLAPLPPAADAARLTLGLARDLEARDPAAAAALCAPLSEALDRTAAAPLRGRGLGVLAAEAHSLEASARARSKPGATLP